MTVEDNTPPTQPSNLTVLILKGNITLSWDASSDYGVVYYHIWRNGQYLGNTTLTFYSDLESLRPGKYEYSIVPIDQVDNKGESLNITVKIRGPWKITPFLLSPTDNIIIILIIIGIIAAGISVSTTVIISRKRQRSISKNVVVSSESLNEDLKDIIHWRMPLKSIKRSLLKEYFQGEFTILSKSEMDIVFRLKISDIEKIEILEELAGLSPEEREEFLKEMENVEEE